MADKRRAKRASNQRSEGARLFREWEGLHADSPPVLYHYTSAQGLLAMVKSGHVWATESRYLNDPREFLHGAELILRVMDQLGGRKPTSPGLDWLRSTVTRHIEEKAQNARIFCASFCQDGDLLSQWRGYGDTGGGYALGFCPELLLGQGKMERPPVRVLRRVIYDPAEQTRLVESWTQAMAGGAVSPQEPLFWRFFSEAVISFKDPAYDEEGEWRLIQFGRVFSSTRQWMHPVEFRERRGRIVPYADLDLSRSTGPYAGKLPVREIVHGPTQDPERSGKALRLLVEARGYAEDQIRLRRSAVPFTA